MYDSVCHPGDGGAGNWGAEVEGNVLKHKLCLMPIIMGNASHRIKIVLIGVPGWLSWLTF